MPDGGYELLCLGGAALLTAVFTPLSIRLAPVIGAMDVPLDDRRMHTHAMPRCGGLALFLSFVLLIPLCGDGASGGVHLLWGATILFLVGVCDDVFRLSATLKLLVQLLAVGAALPGVLPPTGAGGFFPALRGAAAVIWVLALTNAHNMMDGLDGLAAGISTAEAGMLGLSLLLCGEVSYARAALLLCGCCLGYLPFNRHPARVFLGDTGSLFLGYALGMLSLRLPVSLRAPTGILPPLLLFAVPLSDLCFAVIRRVSRGQSPFAADRGHWHHRLIDAGLGQRQVCFWLILPATLLGTAALLLMGDVWNGFAAAVAVLAAAGSLAVLSARTAGVRRVTLRG